MTAHESAPTLEDVIGTHRLAPRPDVITPGGNPVCLCGWVGFNYPAHLADAIQWLTGQREAAEAWHPGRPEGCPKC